MPPNNTDPCAWPNPDIATQDRKHLIDDLRHAAYNGRGQYLDASDPTSLQQALEDTISSIADRIGTSAAVTFNTGT
jgi:type IV pilus assembly protein PilY1